MRLVLLVKKKDWYTALETAKPNANETKKAQWDKIDTKVQSILVNAVSDKILDETGHETTAKEMLDIFDSVYLQKTMMRILAKKRLLNLKMNDVEDAEDLFSSFWETNKCCKRCRRDTLTWRKAVIFVVNFAR